MKKFLLSAGALLLAAGLALSWAGTRMGGESRATVRLFGHSWDVYAPTTGWNVVSTTVHEVYAASSTPTPSLSQAVDQAQQSQDVVFTDSDSTQFSSISLDVDLGSVTIAAGDDYGVEINTWGAGYEVNHWYSGGTLTIESNDSGSVLPANCGSDITIYVPVSAWLESLYVDLDLGDLTLAGLHVEQADIDLDLGSLTGDALVVTTSFQVDADLGEVNLSGDLGEYVDISADLGSVQLGLTRPADEYCWQLEADLGSITVDGKKQHVNDENEVTGGYGGRVIEVDASLGSITVDFDQDFGGAVPHLATPRPEKPAPPSAVAQEGTATVTEDRGSEAAPDSVWAETTAE